MSLLLTATSILLTTMHGMATKLTETEPSKLSILTTSATISSSPATHMPTGLVIWSGSMSTHTIPALARAVLALSSPALLSPVPARQVTTSRLRLRTTRVAIWYSSIANCSGMSYTIVATLSCKSATTQSTRATSECRLSSTETQTRLAWRTSPSSAVPMLCTAIQCRVTAL